MKKIHKYTIFFMMIFSIVIGVIIIENNKINENLIDVMTSEKLTNEKILRVDEQSASVGDIINFTIKPKVTKIIEIESILSKGLTIKDVSKLTITIGEKKYNDFSLKVESNLDNTTTLKIIFEDFIDTKEEIIINYSVLVNEKATEEKDNINNVKIIYSNGETTNWVTDMVYVYTYAIDFINKNSKNEEVENVKFILQLSDEKYAIFNEDNIFIDRVEKIENATILTSNSEGRFEILGLKTGSYKLIEIEAPNGYNKPDFSFNFIIGQNVDKNGKLKNATFDYISDMSYSSSKKYMKDTTSKENSFEIKIFNAKEKENIIRKIFFQ